MIFHLGSVDIKILQETSSEAGLSLAGCGIERSVMIQWSGPETQLHNLCQSLQHFYCRSLEVLVAIVLSLSLYIHIQYIWQYLMYRIRMYIMHIVHSHAFTLTVNPRLHIVNCRWVQESVVLPTRPLRLLIPWMNSTRGFHIDSKLNVLKQLS